MEFRNLFASDFVLVTPLDHDLLKVPEIRLKDIAGYPLILLGSTSYARRLLERLMRREGLQYNITLEMDIVEMAKRYVEIGMGITVSLEYDILAADREKLGIRSLKGIIPATQIGVVTLRGKFLSRSLRNFTDTVVAGIGHDSSLGPGA